jgi:hypothetical protein
VVLVVGAKTLLVAFASLVGVASVGAVAAAQQDRGFRAVTADAAPVEQLVAVAAQEPAVGSAAPSVDLGGPAATPEPTVAPVPADTESVDIEPVADTQVAPATTGELWVTYRSEVVGSITTVVLAEGGTVVSSAILQSAVAHRFELPAGTYLVDVMQSSGVVTEGDVATSSATAVRSGPVEVTVGGRVDLDCAFSGCEVR